MGYWVVLTDQPARAAAHQLIAAVLPQGQPAPSFGAAVGLWLVLWALIVLAGLVVAIDLGIEHPLTNSPMTYVALGGTMIGTLAFIAFLVNGFASFLDAGGKRRLERRVLVLGRVVACDAVRQAEVQDL